jgi:hypothetical protein
MTTDIAEKSKPAPLPATVREFMSLRKSKSLRTLNDQIEELHLTLYEKDEHYKAFLEAVWDSDAVEGSLAIDNVMAAKLIREHAGKGGNVEVGRRKLDTIVKCLGVVLRRYGSSRKERRNTVGGELISDTGNGND